MSSQIPSAEEQLKFLQKMQRLLDEGQFTSTYKFALLIALSDLAVELGDETSAPLELDSQVIAEKFIQLYWRQAIPFPLYGGGGEILSQNTGQQAAVINRIADAYRSSGGSMAGFRSTRDYTGLVRQVAAIVQQMPLWKLQNIGSEMDDFLYENRMSGYTIELRPGVAYCLRTFHGQILSMVQGTWVHWVRKAKKNQSILGQTADLNSFLFGTDRASLATHAEILKDFQHNNCFYCGKKIQKQGEVDHFVPWSRYPIDLGHNFVLAHKSCNNAKSNLLASINHLQCWTARNVEYGEQLAIEFDRERIVHNKKTSMSVARWAYYQAATTHSHLWIEKDCHEKADSRWEEVLSG